jgi:serine/threonine protein kinase
LNSGALQDATVETFSLVLKIAVGVSAGLTHLHHKELIHCDVAARNVLLDEQNRAYVCDFGLSRLLPKGKQVGVDNSPGPVFWMAPESLELCHYSKKTDVYMFGVFLWELFARREPYTDLPMAEGASVDTYLQNIGDRVRSGLRPTLPESWPEELTTIMNNCWNLDPADRCVCLCVCVRVCIC